MKTKTNIRYYIYEDIDFNLIGGFRGVNLIATVSEELIHWKCRIGMLLEQRELVGKIDMKSNIELIIL